MALQLMRNSILCRITKQFYRNSNNKPKFMSTNTPKADEKPFDIHNIGTIKHAVSNFDKRLLVWVKRYPSMADVPKEVTRDCIVTARSKARVRVCNIMIAFTLVAFLCGIYSGKRDVAAGKSLHNIRMEWYEGLRREHEAEQAALLAAEADKK